MEAILLDGHFVLEHGGRSRANVFFNFNGTAGMWRRCAIDDAGGWQHDTLTEDTDLSYRAQLKGWKLQISAGRRVSGRAAHRDDRLQDAAGALGQGPDPDLRKKDSAARLAQRRPSHTKLEAWYHLTANLSYPLMIVLSVLSDASHDHPLLSGLVPDDATLTCRCFMASTFSISSFYLVSQKELFPGRWYRTFLYLPFLMSLGIGLTITNTRRCWRRSSACRAL